MDEESVGSISAAAGRDRRGLAGALVAIALVVSPGCYSSTARVDIGPRLDGGPADGGLPFLERDAAPWEPGDDADTGSISPSISRSISAGAFHACALAADRTVWCWGRNHFGQLGDGTTTDRASPVPVIGLGPVAEVSAGSQHTCARLDDGTVRCWGENAAGALGDGSTRESAIPVEVVGLRDAIELVLNDNVMPDQDTSCARRATGEAVCWGNNTTGQLGDGSTTSRSVPAPVIGVHDAIALALGRNFGCAVRADRSVLCWGLDGTTVDLVTRPVEGLGRVAAITAGETHTCTLATDGSVSCWYAGAPAGEYVRPALLPVIAIDAGSSSTCALTAGGDAYCWGWHGLASGTSDETVRVPGLSGITEITSGGMGGCARLRGGEIWCWGHNEWGQVGDGTTTNRAAPVPVAFGP